MTKKTTNMLFLTDKQGIPLVCTSPLVGNHNDVFEIKKCISKIAGVLKNSKISIFIKSYLYKKSFVVERTNT